MYFLNLSAGLHPSKSFPANDSTITLGFPIDVNVKFSNLQVYDTEIQLPEIMDLSDAGVIPTCLRIRGWTFRVPITRRQETEQCSVWSVSWIFPWYTTTHSTVCGKFSFDDNLVPGNEMTFETLGLILSMKIPRQMRAELGFLVLQERTHQGTFEQLGYTDRGQDGEDLLCLLNTARSPNSQVRLNV
jgi:hypothetical protein